MDKKFFNLGLTHSVVDLIDSIPQGELILIKEENQTNNPYSRPQNNYSVVLRENTIAITQLSAERTRQLFGSLDQLMYSCLIRQTEVQIKTGTIAIIESNDRITGVVSRVDDDDVGGTIVYINTSKIIPKEVLNLI